MWYSRLSQRAITPADGFESRGSISSRMICSDIPDPCSPGAQCLHILPVFKMFVKSSGELELIKVEPTQEMTHSVPLSHHMTLSNYLLLVLCQSPNQYSESSFLLRN